VGKRMAARKAKGVAAAKGEKRTIGDSLVDDEFEAFTRLVRLMHPCNRKHEGLLPIESVFEVKKIIDELDRESSARIFLAAKIFCGIN
jgi:hypothetical protein